MSASLDNRPPNPTSFSSTPRRIVVIGTTGSGKTTLAGQLAQQLGVSHVELDSIYWGPNWTELANDLFRKRTAETTSGDAWVLDGNYSSKVRDIIWSRAEMVIWLDYTLPVMLWRLTKRTLRRVATKEALWSGNRETVRKAFLSTDSIFMWLLRTYRKKRKEYPVLLSAPEHAHLAVVHLRSPKETRRWLRQFEKQGEGVG